MYTDTAHVDPPLLESPVEEPPSLEVNDPFLDHRDLRQDEFWRGIPAYTGVSDTEFRTHLWQQKNSVTNVRQLRDTLGDLAPEAFYEDLAAGIANAPMA